MKGLIKDCGIDCLPSYMFKARAYFGHPLLISYTFTWGKILCNRGVSNLKAFGVNVIEDKPLYFYGHMNVHVNIYMCGKFQVHRLHKSACSGHVLFISYTFTWAQILCKTPVSTWGVPAAVAAP